MESLWTEAVVVAVVGLVSVVLGNIVVGLFQWRRVPSQNRLDDSEVAQKYQEMAAQQADENKKLREEFNAKIEELTRAINGPWDIHIVAQTGAQPDILEATIQLSPKAVLNKVMKEKIDG